MRLMPKIGKSSIKTRFLCSRSEEIPQKFSDYLPKRYSSFPGLAEWYVKSYVLCPESRDKQQKFFGAFLILDSQKKRYYF